MLEAERVAERMHDREENVESTGFLLRECAPALGSLNPNTTRDRTARIGNRKACKQNQRATRQPPFALARSPLTRKIVFVERIMIGKIEENVDLIGGNTRNRFDEVDRNHNFPGFERLRDQLSKKRRRALREAGRPAARSLRRPTSRRSARCRSEMCLYDREVLFSPRGELFAAAAPAATTSGGDRRARSAFGALRFLSSCRLFRLHC